MEVKQHHSVKDFLKTTETLLLGREAENNLPLGILHNQKQMNADELYMLTVHHEGECIYSIMRTPPHYWILPSVDVNHKQPVKTLVEYLAEHSFKVPGVIGEASAAEAFVQAYREKNRGLAELHMRQGVYELKKVNELQNVRGKLRIARKPDEGWLHEWFKQFYKETNEVHGGNEIARTVKNLIRSERTFIYIVDGENVSMVSRARNTPNGAAVNGVFTPAPYRRQGYASEAVSLLSKQLLEEGNRFCALYTDLANPSSNSIYQKVGFKKAGETLVYHLME